MICKYCLGCNKMTEKDFKDNKRRCDNFVPCEDNWYEKYNEEVVRDI